MGAITIHVAHNSFTLFEISSKKTDTLNTTKLMPPAKTINASISY